MVLGGRSSNLTAVFYSSILIRVVTLYTAVQWLKEKVVCGSTLLLYSSSLHTKKKHSHLPVPLPH